MSYYIWNNNNLYVTCIIILWFFVVLFRFRYCLLYGSIRHQDCVIVLSGTFVYFYKRHHYYFATIQPGLFVTWSLFVYLPEEKATLKLPRHLWRKALHPSPSVHLYNVYMCILWVIEFFQFVFFSFCN